MGILFEEVADPGERKKKLTENGIAICNQMKDLVAAGRLSEIEVNNLSNALIRTLRAIDSLN